MDDALGVRVLDGPAHLHEQFQPLARRELVLVTELGDRHPVHQLHHEVRAAGVGGAGVEDPGDVGVVHHRQRLALGLEPGDELSGVEPGLDYFERDLAPDGRLLLGHEDDAAPALADALEELVATDDGAGAFADSNGGEIHGRGDLCKVEGFAHEAFVRLVRRQQRVDPLTQAPVLAASTVEVGRALRGVRPGDCGSE